MQDYTIKNKITVVGSCLDGRGDMLFFFLVVTICTIMLTTSSIDLTGAHNDDYVIITLNVAQLQHFPKMYTTPHVT